MNKKTKKVLSLALAAVLLVCTTVAATVAYLTANTDVVTNTFTVGKVEIDLDEAEVDLYGDEVQGAARRKFNEYKLIPGHDYTKDPIVYVKPGSEECYVFIKVENGLDVIESTENGYTSIADQIAANGWKQLVDVAGNEVANVFYYKDTVVNLPAENETPADVLLPVFEGFTIDGEAVLYNADGNFIYEDAEITIDAYAVQADGFADAAAAWDAAATTWETV